jgi:hypothetical protein
MTEFPAHSDRLTQHQFRLDNWHGPEAAAQRHAEHEGHVPPGVKPVHAKRWEFSSEYVWQWITGEDTTGNLKEMWFADGPWVGQRPRMIDADTQKGDLVAFPRFDIEDEFESDGTLARTDHRYKVDQREDGLWYGRWVG